jgi:hypothetical protein
MESTFPKENSSLLLTRGIEHPRRDPHDAFSDIVDQRPIRRATHAISTPESCRDRIHASPTTNRIQDCLQVFQTRKSKSLVINTSHSKSAGDTHFTLAKPDPFGDDNSRTLSL